MLSAYKLPTVDCLSLALLLPSRLSARQLILTVCAGMERRAYSEKIMLICMYIYLFRCMSRLGMLIRVTARAILSIERGGQFCGPRCITWCSSRGVRQNHVRSVIADSALLSSMEMYAFLLRPGLAALDNLTDTFVAGWLLPSKVLD